jgi:hypothetical protein
MTRAHKLTRTAWSIAAVFMLALVLAVPASASVTSEQQEGAQTLSAVHAGKLKGTSLSSSQYEHVGEYLMGQALGSTAAHERMNSLADQMMGSAAVDQMHVYLGERYLGKSTAQLSGRYAPMYGLIGMMTGYRGSGSSIAGMMSGYLNSQTQSTTPYTGGTGMMGSYRTQTSATPGTSVAPEQQEGAQVLSAVHSGKLKGTSLSSSQYEHVGEYLMGRALGSTASHERMNSLMGAMMGSTAADQMHVYLGERYLGKSAQIPGRYAPMYGLIGMMTGYRGSGSSIAGMMSGYLNSQTQSTTPYSGSTGMMGYYGTSANSTGGLSTGAIVAIVILAALLLGGGLALTMRMLRGRGHGDRHTTPRAS